GSSTLRPKPPYRVSPLDLHVLGTPPAFVLSQDQTLHPRYHNPLAPSGARRIATSTESLNGPSKPLAAPHPAQSLAPGGTQGTTRTHHSRTRCLVVKDQPSGFPSRIRRSRKRHFSS